LIDRSLPGDSVIRFDQADIAVTWNEYVFWECWLLARKGAAQVDAATYTPEFQMEVLQVLSLVHNLVDPADYPANLEALLAQADQPTEPTQATQPPAGDTAETTAPTEPAAPVDGVAEAITAAAGESFLKMQAIYRAIFQAVTAQ
jgi:hypothetical protein